MRSSARSARVAPRSIWRSLLNLLGSALWTLFAVFYAIAAVRQGDFLDMGLCLFYLIVGYLMLSRRPAARAGTWWELALGWGSAIVPLAILRPVSGGWVLPAAILQGLGMAGMLAGVCSLGRSFGIAPADRGLVTRGPYRLIRHPMYASELIFDAGFVLANPSWINALALLLIAGTQVARILREERVIGGYPIYAARVRWRLIPGIW
ncbi:MAG: isoprenylcysteine carboxyl methyltransferase [Chloroflexi bacterium]|nr:isoprenylcysteine carboxyl methyltransferase [Chloroflexota bacterium]